MRVESDELTELLPIFFAEAEQYIATLDGILVALESSPDDAGGLPEVLRAMHTLKGSAAMLGLDAIAAVAHASEDVLAAVRDGGSVMTGAKASLLLEATQAIAHMVHGVSQGRWPEPGSHGDLVTRLSSCAADAPGEVVSVAEPAATPPVAAGDVAARKAGESPRRDPSGRTLRVDVAKLDRLVDLVSEIALARRTLAGRADSLAGDPRALCEALEDGDRTVAELQATVTSLRLVPLGSIFRRFVRAVRDAAVATGKQAQLTTLGDEVEVDTAVAEALVEPLTHLVRNAVDHGIEPPGERLAAGKSPSGNVTIRARRDSASIVVEVQDDGGGLRRGRLLDRARRHGIGAYGDEVADEHLHALIFQPGFSTAASVSDLSGRGVGMDIVRRMVEGLRGSVEVRSQEGSGTTFSIRVPLMVSTIDGLQVQVDEATYVVPIDNVVECVVAPRGVGANDEGVVDLRGTAIPYARLRSVLGHGEAAPDREHMLVLRHGSHLAGLLVDRLLGQAETVVRPLEARIRSRLSGSTLLEDGRVALILDVPSLLQQLSSPGPRDAVGEAASTPTPAAPAPLAIEGADASRTWTAAPPSVGGPSSAAAERGRPDVARDSQEGSQQRLVSSPVTD